MNVNLGTVFDEFIAQLLKTGMYQSQSEVVREGLRLLKEREELKNLRLAELRKEIAVGSEQAGRGKFVDGEETFAEIRRRSAKRKRAKQDVNDIWDHIADDTIETADRVLDALDNAMVKLVNEPRCGRSLRPSD